MIFKRMMIVPRIAFILMLLLPAGCAKKLMVAEEEPTPAVTESALFMERYTAKAESPQAPVPADQAVQPAQRLRHHDGIIKMRAAKPDEVLDQAAGQAKKAGGYVESLEGNRMVLRIPSARFQEVFDGLLALGDVLEKSITVQDITEQYTNVELRLKIAQATRRRMLELLAKARDEKEKLAILKEIERLSTEIEYLTTQRDTLMKMAQFARLTLEVQERNFDQGRAGVQIRAFDWIARLSPFEKSVAISGDELKLRPPSGFVVLENPTPWAAESADGVAVWASRQTNIPAGDTSFWLQAVRQRLEPEFASAKVVSAGGFRALRLVGRGQNVYVYLVALRATRDQDKFDLVEIYFPSREHETRHGAAVLDILAKGDK